MEESKTIYSKEFILKCRESELSREKPKNWDFILSKFPAIVKVSFLHVLKKTSGFKNKMVI